MRFGSISRLHVFAVTPRNVKEWLPDQAMRKKGKKLQRSFFCRSSPVVAAELLNKLIVVEDSVGRIVETEAYGASDDPASHGHRGRTARNEIMFGRPGLLYVYFTYGMHWCANVVTGKEGESSAVLLRAVEPLSGLSQMRCRRLKSRNDRGLCNGPAKLAQAFGLNGDWNGVDLLNHRSISIRDDGVQPPKPPGMTTRIGLSKGTDIPWRFVVEESPFLSR